MKFLQEPLLLRTDFTSTRTNLVRLACLAGFLMLPAMGPWTATTAMAAQSVKIKKLVPPLEEAFPADDDPEFAPEKLALRERFLDARAAFARRDFPLARALYRELHETYPAFRDYYYRDLGRMALLEADRIVLPPEAIAACFDNADRLAAYPGTRFEGWAHYFRARALLALGRLEEAETELSLALATHASAPSAVIYFHLGVIHEQAENAVDAYRDFRRTARRASGALELRATEAAQRIGAELDDKDKWIDWELEYAHLHRKLERRASHDLLRSIEEALKDCPSPEVSLDLARLRALCYLRLRQRTRGIWLLERQLEAELERGTPRWETVDPIQRDLREQKAPEKRTRLLRRFVAAKPGKNGLPAYFLLAYLEKDEDRYDRAITLYREVAARFADEPEAVEARWQLALDHLRRKDWAGAELELTAILRVVSPGSMDEAQARYWLGRALWMTGDTARATAVFDDVAFRFPFTYYGTIAEERGYDRPLAFWVPHPIEPISWTPSFSADQPAKLGLEQLSPGFEARLAEVARPGPACHLEKAKELWLVGNPGVARRELYASVHHKDVSSGARWMAAALRHAMGSSSAGMEYGLQYLRSLDASDPVVPGRAALAYPMPYLPAVFEHALARGLEPALVGAIIRQESRFQAGAGSRKGAKGLMQIMPYTGRIISRWLGIKRYPSYYLLKPDFNLRLGTKYIRAMLEQYGGSLARALAAYNAGPTIVDQWLRRLGPIDDDLFVEQIPYRETRGYVRSVIRNLDGYLKVYGSHTATSVNLAVDSRTFKRCSDDNPRTAPPSHLEHCSDPRMPLSAPIRHYFDTTNLCRTSHPDQDTLPNPFRPASMRPASAD